MDTMLLSVFQTPYLMSMLHRCSLEDRTPPFHYPSMAHITRALPQVSVITCRCIKLWLTSFRSFHVCPVAHHPKCRANKCVSPSRHIFSYYLKAYPHGYSIMACFMTIRDLRDLQVHSSIILHNRHYIILVIRHCSPLTLLFTCLQ